MVLCALNSQGSVCTQVGPFVTVAACQAAGRAVSRMDSRILVTYTCVASDLVASEPK
jgi:hypothetical protein